MAPEQREQVHDLLREAEQYLGTADVHLVANRPELLVRAVNRAIGALRDIEQVLAPPPHDIPSLYQYLKRHPRVEETNYNPDYGVRTLRFYGVSPMTGVFQFDVEGERGRTAGLSFGTARSHEFRPDGLVVRDDGGEVSYKYMPD